MRICKVKGCGKKHKARGYCNKHVNQIYAHGRILKRNRLDPNDIVLRGNNAVIILRNNLGDKIGETIINENDLNIAKKHKWHLNNTGYAVTRIDKSKQILLHHFYGKDTLTSKVGEELPSALAAILCQVHLL